MARKLQEIPVIVFDSGGNYYPKAMTSSYVHAFREFGIDLTALETEEAVKRIRASSIHREVAAALEDWAIEVWNSEGEKPNRNELLAIVRAVDPDPLRNRLRDAREKMDPAALIELAALPEILEIGPRSLKHLGIALTAKKVRRNKEAVVLLAQAQRMYPGDYSINELLGHLCRESKPPRLDEAIRCFSAAVAIHPENQSARINLGVAFADRGDVDEAIEVFRHVVRHMPSHIRGYMNLGSALWRNGDLDGAIAAYTQGVRYQPDVFGLRLSLGSALRAKGQLEAALVEGQECIRLGPQDFRGYVCLSDALVKLGRFDEARKVLREGEERVSGNPRHEQELANYRRTCENEIKLEIQLSRVLKGEAKPITNVERLMFAERCAAPDKRLYLAAVRLFEQAFAEDPKLIAGAPSEPRYNAACCAVQAGCGQGKDSSDLAPKERARLRNQALDWLRADLDAWNEQMKKEPEKTRTVVRQMQHWQKDTDFARVRGSEALAKLPEAERTAWEKPWSDVAGTLATGQKTAPAEKASAK
jgi:tetratricopeptide (TPR) repeat protein